MRVNKGLDQARPEWPAAASATGTAPVFETGTGALGGGAVQRFPETAAVPAARIEDPWERSGPDAAGPGELTVRLDRAEAGADRPDAARGCDGKAGGSERPVFVDESGRRSRRFRRIGMAVGLSCGAYAVVIAATLVSGNSNAPWLPVPGQGGGDKPASKVETSPEPTESALPSGTGAGAAVPGRPGRPGVSGISAPGTGAATGSAGPSTGAGTSAPTASAGPGGSGATAGPAPTATATGRAKPPAGGVTGPTTAPTPPPASTPADPTPSGGSGPTAPDPSASPGAGSGGGDSGGSGSGGGGGAATNAPGTVADGPSSPVPVTGEPVAGASGSATAPGPATSPGPTGAPAGDAGSGSAVGAQVTTTARTVA
ncbi:translation initiation factor IF-2 [Streptomyces seoulensis]